MNRPTLGRTVLGSSGIIALGGFAARFFPLLTAPILTRLLGPAPYAVAALFGTVTALGNTAALGGIDQAYSRFYFGGVDADGAEVERLCWRYATLGSAAAAAVAAILWRTALAGWFDIDPALWSMAAVAILLGVANVMAMTRIRVRGQYRRIAIAKVALGAVTAICSVAFAYMWRRDAWALIAGVVCGLAVSTALQGVPALADLRRRATLPPGTAWRVIQLGLPAVFTGLTYWVMISADRWMLSYFSGNAQLGVYTFAASVGSLGLLLNSALTLVWFPEIARVFEEKGAGSIADFGRLWVGLVLGLGVVWLFVTAFGVDALRFLAAPEFHPGAAYIPWIAGFMFFRGLGSMANTGHWLNQDLRPQAVWSVVGVVLQLGLNLWLIPRHGAIAAAIIACGTGAFIAVGVMWSAERRLSISPSWAKLLPALLVVAVAGTLMSGQWASNPLLSAFAKVPLFLVLCLVLTRAVMPEWITAGMAIIRSRRP